jgi:hypothetical protein
MVLVFRLPIYPFVLHLSCDSVDDLRQLERINLSPFEWKSLFLPSHHFQSVQKANHYRLHLLKWREPWKVLMEQLNPIHRVTKVCEC